MNRITRFCLLLLLAGAALGAHLSARDHHAVVRVEADAARRQVLVAVSAIEIPAATGYDHHSAEERVTFKWPATGWMRGYRMDLYDAEGHLLPRTYLHHAGVVNLQRRQLPYPELERVIAVGRETPPILLPESMGIPLAADQDMVLYYALVNPADRPVTGVTLKLTVTWTPERTEAPRSVFPLYLDANPKTGHNARSFDVPPGLSATSAQFTLPASGRLRAAGGHLHDYAVEIRLEDVVTGSVLVRLKTKRDASGRLISVDSTKFVFSRGGLHLKANHPYRVVSIYDNPTGETIPLGAMAFMAGPFIPDDVKDWPAIDTLDQAYQRDLAEVLGKAKAPVHRHGG